MQWRVEERGGDPARPTRIKRLAIVLNNTSKESGVCMNRPLVPAEPAGFDLEFAPTTAPDPAYDLSIDGQSLVITDAWVAPRRGEIAVDVYDSGASGVLTAAAELEDGRVLRAIVEGTGAEELPIPITSPASPPWRGGGCGTWRRVGWRTSTTRTLPSATASEATD